MTPITIDIECKDRMGFDKHFCTVVASVLDVHKALMDCMNAIDRIGWGYIGHTITVNSPSVEEGADNE